MWEGHGTRTVNVGAIMPRKRSQSLDTISKALWSCRCEHLPWHHSYQPSRKPAWRGLDSLLWSAGFPQKQIPRQLTLEADIQVWLCVAFDSRRHGEEFDYVVDVCRPNLLQ